MKFRTQCSWSPVLSDWRPIHKCVELSKDETLEGRPSLFQIKVFGTKTNFSLELNRLNDVDNIYVSDKTRINANSPL